MDVITDNLFVCVDELLAHGAARLQYYKGTYGRVLGLAALGHLCTVLSAVRNLSDNDGDEHVSSVLTRNHFETFSVGICLLLGDERVGNLFLGSARRHELIQLAELDKLIELGAFPIDFVRPREHFADVAAKRWGINDAFKLSSELLVASGVAEGANHLYTVVYRPLSNQMGAHPSPHVFDRYFSNSGVWARVSRNPTYPLTNSLALKQTQINFASTLYMTTLYSVAAAHRLDAPRETFDGLMDQLKEINDFVSPFLHT